MADKKLYVKSPFPQIEGGDPLFIDRELGKIEIGFQQIEKVIGGAAIDQEARDDLATVKTRVTTLELTNDNALALIEEERRVRLEADLAEAYARITLKAELDGNTAQLQQEQTARVTADQAFAEQLTTLDTDYQGNKANVTQQLTTISTATSSLATTVTQLSANVELNTAGLIEERIARVTEDEALAAKITTLTTNFNNNVATVTQSILSLSNADSAQTQSIQNLSSVVNENIANVYEEINTLATADQSLASQINTVSATVGTKNRTYFQANPPVQSAINTVSVGDLWFDTDENNKIRRWSGSAWVDVLDPVTITAAAVSNEAITRATADSALAQNIQTVVTSLNGQTATVQTLSDSVDGIKAKWSVRINNNGAISGIELNSGADAKSVFKVQADKFQLEPQSGGTISPFYVEGNTTYIENAVIKNGSISQIATGETSANDLFLNINVTAGDRVTILGSFLASNNNEVPATANPGLMTIHVNGVGIMQRQLAYYRFRDGTAFIGSCSPTTYQVIWTAPSTGIANLWLANRPGWSGNGSAMTVIINKK